MSLTVKFWAGLGVGVVCGIAAAGFVASRLAPSDAKTQAAQISPAAKTVKPSADAKAGAGQSRSRRMPAVAYAVARPATVGVTVEAVGVARSSRAINIAAEVGGVIRKVNFAPGQRVAKGDLLIKIDDREQQIALARARAQYPIAKRNAERYADLAEADAGSMLEADDALNTLQTLQADLNAAQFAVSQRTIVAPFDGVVGLTPVEPGDLVSVGDILTTLDDTDAVVVEFAVPQESASDMSLGQRVFAEAPRARGPRMEGVVTAVDTRVDPVSRTLGVEALFANDDRRLLPGAVYAVKTTNEGAAALRAPGLAVQWDRAGSFVWVLGEDNKARRASVTILQRSDDEAVIDGAVAAGDVIVAEGGERVRAGMNLPPPSRGAEGSKSGGQRSGRRSGDIGGGLGGGVHQGGGAN